MTQNRKRTRNFQDETEFMPLSKRINNLHINNMLNDRNLPLQSTEWGTQGQSSLGNIQNNNQLPLPDSPTGSERSLDWTYNSGYAPDLNEAQNPHYFNINKLLYEMYMERTNRGCHQI